MSPILPHAGPRLPEHETNLNRLVRGIPTWGIRRLPGGTPGAWPWRGGPDDEDKGAKIAKRTIMGIALLAPLLTAPTFRLHLFMPESRLANAPRLYPWLVTNSLRAPLDDDCQVPNIPPPFPGRCSLDPSGSGSLGFACLSGRFIRPPAKIVQPIIKPCGHRPTGKEGVT